MNRLSRERRSHVLRALVEGNVRAACRITGTAKGTVLTLLSDAGAAGSTIRIARCGISPARAAPMRPEIWAFCYAKEKNVPEEHRGQFGYGDVWTWTAIDAPTPSSSLPSWWGTATPKPPTPSCATSPAASPGACNSTTDGAKPYLEAVEGAFGADIDYAMPITLYGTDPEAERRYSPATCIEAEQRRITGNPDAAHISTSHAERQNLTMGMQMRRFTLTNAFSKKVENLEHAITLHFMHYNFARRTRPSPAATSPYRPRRWRRRGGSRLVYRRNRGAGRGARAARFKLTTTRRHIALDSPHNNPLG